MALGSPGIVDVVALIAAPVIRARDVASGELPASLVPVTPTLSVVTSTVSVVASTVASVVASVGWLALVALLAHVPEIKVQKIATGTVPLPVLPFLTSVPGTRTGAVLLLTLLIGLLLGIGKNALQHAQLRLDQPGNPLHHVHLGRV